MRETLLLLSLLVTVQGQVTPPEPSFEVASVKLAPESAITHASPTMRAAWASQVGFTGGPGTSSPLRIHYKDVSLKLLIAKAWSLRPEQVTGPAWLDSDLYEITATLPPGTDKEALLRMLQGLLKERFGLALHRETKVQQVYLLTVAKGGPKLAPAEEAPKYQDDREAREATRAKAMEAIKAMQRGPAPGEIPANRRFHLPAETLDTFAQRLASDLNRPVLNRTGIEGKYAFTLAWMTDRTGASNPESPSADLTGPSIFAAVQEQLGLRLQPDKEEVDLLVVDSASKIPTAN